MNRLETELQRLHLLPGAAGETITGRTGAMLLEVVQPAGWEPVAAVWQGVQADLDLPAPAISVDGREAYQLWFSLAEPVSTREALAFLEGLRTRYLAGVRPERVRSAAWESSAMQQLPPAQVGPDRWSAFVAPDLAPLFADERCLDLAPGADAQAELLSRVQAIRPAEWQRALGQLRPTAPAAASAPESAAAAAPAPEQDPRRFLLQVMNDPAVDLHLRIEAAKALLPFFERERGG